MASCFPLCEKKTFTIQEIGRFSDRIQNILETVECRKIFKDYLHQVRRQDLLKVLKLWEDANIYLKLSENFDEDAIMDQIDEIDDFNTNPFLSISENKNKLLYVKQECSRILAKVLNIFVKYLEQHHRK